MARNAAQVSRADWDGFSLILRYLIAFPIATKQHLQRRLDPREYIPILPLADLKLVMNAQTQQTMILAALSMLIRPLRVRDDGTGKLLALWSQLEAGIAQLQATASQLNLVVRVKLPTSYALHTARFIFLWVATLPFALVDIMPPPLVFATMVFVAWALYSTEELAQLMEEPFGSAKKPETVPVSELCRQIVQELQEHVFIIDALDSRVMSGSWTVKPEDLVPRPSQTDGMDISDTVTVD